MRLLPFLLAAAALPGICAAQDDGSPDNAIRATTTLHADGSKTVTVTNPDTHSSEADTYDARNRLTQKVVYALDENNQPASGVIYNAANVAVFKSSYKRDDANRISEEDDYTMADQLIRRFVYEFNSDGSVARIRAFDGEGNELRQTAARPDRRQSLPRVHR